MLKILALGPLNGLAISQRLKQVSGDVLRVSDGSLCPVLHKLDRRAAITVEREAGNWNRLSRALSHVVKRKEA